MATTQKTTLDVEGMTCHSCVRHVQGALRELDGVRSVEVQLREGKVLVEHEGAETVALIEALRDAGYESRASERS